eukprot:CAMPEP_0178916578 /NCGR_PEP_ID=MMETSP0786-20121207/12730_1 /TAXON_ID=186022 /ORGANISM="Thalassionema frauenfeldii, Strain CCMP 1798" /LENGTH=242 /DNA_ID=CAMNT_0020589955 /DNA_START=71 /DNA_END=799 /DNA_ORIENTATION=+
MDRRTLLTTTATATASGLILPNQQPALADDLTSQLYNDDGSLRDDVQQEAKEKLLTFQWEESNDGVIQVDGKVVSGSTNTSPKVKLEYKVPEKWVSTSDSLYIDPSEGANARAASHIYVYQAPGTVTAKQLSQASVKGVGKALSVLSPQLDQVRGADLVSGSRIDDATYDFDVAWAPPTCSGGNANDLGLGFCPYEQIYLLRATLLDDRLYVLCIQATNQEWKQANAELKRLRHSFQVTSLV